MKTLPTFEELRRLEYKATHLPNGELCRKKDEHEDYNIRMHRIISWGVGAEGYLNSLKQNSEKGQKKLPLEDITFISYWISFNALYGGETNRDNTPEYSLYEDMLRKIIEADKNDLLQNAILKGWKYARMLVSNPFVYKETWRCEAFTKEAADAFDRYSLSEQKNLLKVLFKEETTGRVNDTYYILREIFEHLYVLRSQLIHGSATFNGSLNRSQVRAAMNFMSIVMPTIAYIAYTNDIDCLAIAYPPIEQPAKN